MTLAGAVMTVSSVGHSAEMTAEALVKRYDEIMAPPKFEITMTMTATRDDGSKRSYGMRALKQGTDKFRIWFRSPAAVAGQEMLRSGDNSWLYLPNVKRASRVADRDSFQGGDFSNADMLRMDYEVDYAPKLVPSDDKTAYQLELTSKRPSTPYAKIILRMRLTDQMPISADYFGTSGKKLRSAVFEDYRELQSKYTRPTRVLMKNEIVPARHTELVIEKVNTRPDIKDRYFSLSDLGR